MKLLKPIAFLSAMLAVGSLYAADGFAAAGNKALPGSQRSLKSLMYKARNNGGTHNAFGGSRFETITRQDDLMLRREAVASRGAVVENFQPDLNYPASSLFGEMDAPNGETWFYTLDLINDVTKYEYYNDYSLREFTINIYDAKGNHRGTVHDKMRYLDSETKRVPLCDMLPLVTNTFFNDNPDDYEIVIAFAINTPRYVNNYRSLAYTIGGEKDADGYDQPISQVNELFADVLQFTKPDGTPGYYFSLVTEHGGGVTEADYDTPEFWEKWCRGRLVIETFKKVNANGSIDKILQYDIPLQQLPGDQESGGYMLSMTRDGEPYMVLSKYREPISEPYYSPLAEDLKQRAGNTLEIEIYKLGDTPQLVQTTSIPFSKDPDDDVIFTYCGIGTLRWTGDVDWDHLGKDGKAGFLVTQCDYRISSDGVSGYHFYAYNPDGTRKCTIKKNCDSAMAVSDVPGQEPQHMFITYDDTYMFHFIDMHTFTKRASFSYERQVEDSDPELLTANIDRVPVGDGYMYVSEMRMPIEDEDNLYFRVAWLTDKGEIDHIDMVNLGPDVRYAKGYITAKALDPNMFYEDPAREYMVLIKRDINPDDEDSTQTIEELYVGQACSLDYPEGRTLLSLRSNERGTLSSIMPYFYTDPAMLSIAYRGRNDDESTNYSVDFYYLPLGSDPAFGGIDNVIADDTNAADAAADGTVYNLQGIRVDKPGKGLYIIGGKKVLL